jgi:hypothetical protein
MSAPDYAPNYPNHAHFNVYDYGFFELEYEACS